MTMQTGDSTAVAAGTAENYTAGTPSHATRSELTLNLPPSYPVDDIFLVNDVIQSAFAEGLYASKGVSARTHLAEVRRLPDWLVGEEGFGYIEPGRTIAREVAKRNGIPFELCVEAGLLRRAIRPAQNEFITQYNRAPESSGELSAFFADQLADREQYYLDYPPLKTVSGTWVHGDWLTIPIFARDTNDALRIAGFQYRSLRPEGEIGKQGRYRSPPNTRALVWEETLLGFAEEREKIATSGDVILVEGKFDQAPVRAAMAQLPTGQQPGAVALGGLRTRGSVDWGATPEDRAGVLAILPRAGARRAIIFLDEEENATMAALRIAALLAPLGMEVHIATVLDGCTRDSRQQLHGETDIPKDPGALWERGGGEAVRNAILGARTRDLLDTITCVIGRRLMKSLQSGQTYRRLEAMDAVLDLLAPLPGFDNARIVALTSQAVHLDPAVVQLALHRRLDTDDRGAVSTASQTPKASHQISKIENGTTTATTSVTVSTLGATLPPPPSGVRTVLHQ